jgi:glutamate-1-semialdehyde 2,1-aminomutase
VTAAQDQPDRSDLHARARARIPGGVNSPVRAFNAVGGEPFFVARGEGAYLIDTDGNRYVDYVQSWGASILGHAHPAIVEAVQRAAADGTSFGASTEREVLLAEAICARVPSVEMVRLVSSGTEAAMTAVRLARGVTGREKIVKFAGCYHGHLDALLVSAGSGVATLGLPGSLGVTAGAVADTIVTPYNDIAELDAVFDEHGDSIAAVLVEPIAANMGLVPAEPAFLDAIRKRCDSHGAMLVLDEVITGFRVGPAGAQGLLGLRPDLSIFGKVVGGGLPLAAIGGSQAIMDHLAPNGAVYQAGTLSGNPLATAAGLAALELLGDSAYVALTDTATVLADGLRKAIGDVGLPVQVPQVQTLAGMFFADAPVTDYEAAQAVDHERYASFFRGMLRRGVYLAPSGYETMFPSLMHGGTEIDRTLTAAAETAAELAT